MTKYLVVLTALAFAHMGASYKCDPSVVEKIGKLWQGKSSTGLLKTLNEAGHCTVVATIAGLLEDEDKIKCLRANFHSGQVENVWVYKNCTKRVFPKFTVTDVNQRDLYTKETKAHRYYLPWNKEDGVASFYLCEEEGKTGNPRGSIVVFSEKYNKKTVSENKKVFASLGLEMVKTYPDKCEMNSSGKSC